MKEMFISSYPLWKGGVRLESSNNIVTYEDICNEYPLEKINKGVVYYRRLSNIGDIQWLLEYHDPITGDISSSVILNIIFENHTSLK